MTDNVKHSTSYYHEAIAHAFEMFKNGYEPIMETPFQPRRLGSAFVTEYKPVRESLDDVVNFDIDKMDKALQSERIEIPESLKMEEFDQFMQDRQLTIQQKWGAEEALNELAAQSQELGMYDKDNGIFDRIVESIESAQNNPEGCVSTLVKVDKEQVKVYSKSELDEMHWNELKPILDAAGIRGRRRANLIRDFLKWQEEQ